MKRSLLLAMLCCALTGLSACGSGGEISRAESEGASITVGGLQYQVQISRQLNAADLEDRDYLAGLGAAERKLASDETFFAVFLRVKNASKTQQQSAGEFTIADTTGKEYEPIPVPNSFGYRAQPLARDAIIPSGIEPASYAPTQGKMLLFKLPYGALDNRPLELEVKSPLVPQQVGFVNLDV